VHNFYRKILDWEKRWKKNSKDVASFPDLSKRGYLVQELKAAMDMELNNLRESVDRLRAAFIILGVTTMNQKDCYAKCSHFKNAWNDLKEEKGQMQTQVLQSWI